TGTGLPAPTLPASPGPATTNTYRRFTTPRASPRVGGLVSERAGPASDQAQLPGGAHGRGPVAHAELLVDMDQVGLHGGLADPEPGGHGPVGATVGDQAQHLHLAPAELGAWIGAGQRSQGGRREHGATSRQVVDGADHIVAAGVLEQEPVGPGLERRA